MGLGIQDWSKKYRIGGIALLGDGLLKGPDTGARIFLIISDV